MSDVETSARIANPAPDQTPLRGVEAIRAYHPFIMLNRLLEGVAPGRSPLPDGAPLLLSVGEPQTPPPAFIAEEMTRAAAGWMRYPPPRGDAAYRQACRDWLERRYGLREGLIDAERQLLPLPGTREGLFFAALAEVTVERDVVLLPNPFYHVYAGAAAAAGATPVFLPATPENGFLPRFEELPAEILRRTALAYLCSPSNPQGAVAEAGYLREALALARGHGFAIAFDECYAELYADTPPTGVLEVIDALPPEPGRDPLEGALIFHSLSKRSSAPGLRCGFVVGEAKRVDRLDACLRVGGAGVPLPVLAAGTRLWREEEHVTANRARYKENFALAERILGNRLGGAAPKAGFFLWLPVEDGEAATVKLWREAGLKTLPGAYMAHAASGPDGREQPNPGAGFLRIALVYEPEVTKLALERLADVLWGSD